MPRANQESETRYRIVVDTPIPPMPYGNSVEMNQWRENYIHAYNLKGYSHRNYSTVATCKQVITLCARTLSPDGPPNPENFKWHLEKAEVVWEWKELDKEA